MFKLASILSSGVKLGFTTLIIAGILAFLGAPTFFGVVLITASVVMTVYAYAAIAFVVGAVYKWLKLRNDTNNA